MTLDNAEFYLVMPSEATNEVANPSSETNQTGKYAHGSGVSIVRSTAQQLYGQYSDEVTPASGVESGIYYGTVNEVSGTAKTFSVGVKGIAGQAMRVQIRTTGAVVLSEQTFTANGYWQTIRLTRTGTANTARRLYVVRDAVASTSKFYVDGWYYSTIDGTYFDGTFKGLNPNAIEYRWNGAPHASTSWRSSQTRSGGTMLRLKDYAKILTVIGLGMAPVVNTAQPTAAGYSVYQGTLAMDREFVFSLAFTGSPDTIEAARQTLINAVRPDLVSPKQPIKIIYQGVDSSGADATEPVEIYAYYVDGLDQGAQARRVDFADVRFRAFFPFISKMGDSSVGLGYTTTVANFANIGYRDIDGQWKAMGSGVNHMVNAIVRGPDNGIYVGGHFTLAGGVANTAYIAKWDGSVWTPLGTGMNGDVLAMAVGPDGALYVGGTFTTAGGGAANRVAKWNGSTWSALGTGTNGNVYALTFSRDGTLYAAGTFTLAGGVANTAYIAKWDGSNWTPLGTGMSGGTPAVYALATGIKGEIYAGGSFTAAGGVSALNIAKWDGANWTALGSGTNLPVHALTFRPDGRLYAGGDFTTAGGITVNYIAGWSGTGWHALGSGVNGTGVNSLRTGPDNFVYAGGTFVNAGGARLPERGAVWTGSIWLPIDVNVQDSINGIIHDYAWDNAGRLYMGGFWIGTNALSATVTATNNNNVGRGSYPVITITGPGTIWQLKNYSTGRSIYFYDLTLLAGETAVLDFRPGKVSFNSSFVGAFGTPLVRSLMNNLAPGTTLDWYLQPGPNNVSLFMTGTTASSGAVMTWQEAYWGKEAAKR